MNPGLHFNVPMDDYVRDPAPEPSLSTGVLHDLIYRTPAHAWWGHPRLNPAWESDASTRGDLGSATHSAILGGKEIVYIPFDDWRKKEAQQLRDAGRSEGKLVLLEKNRAVIESATRSAYALIGTLIEDRGYVVEGTMLWEADGTWKRGRFDLWAKRANYLIDVKTCTSANPTAWIKSTLVQGGYDIQAEHYLEGLRAVGEGNDRTQFLFLLVEIEPPFACSFVGLDPAFSDFAKRKIVHATKVWRACVKENRWPGYSVYPHWAELAPWNEADLELKLAYAKEVQA